jgi:hypothetical protein
MSGLGWPRNITACSCTRVVVVGARLMRRQPALPAAGAAPQPNPAHDVSHNTQFGAWVQLSGACLLAGGAAGVSLLWVMGLC